MAAAEAQIRLSLVDRVTGPIRRLQARLANLSASLGINRISSQIGNVGRSISNMGSSASVAMGRLTGLTSMLGLGGAGALAGGFLLTQQVSDLAKEISNMSAVAGLASEPFQRLVYAARTVGVEQDKLADILKDTNDKIGDYFQTGAGPMADFFENIAPKIGITKKAFQGLSSSDALQLYYTSLERANLSQAEMTFYLEALASDATLLQPLLANNGAEFRRLGDEAARTGNILGEDVLQYTKRYREATTALGGRLTGLRNIIGVQLLPTVTELVEKMNGWFDANAMLVRSTIVEWIGRLKDGIKAALDPTSDFRVGLGDLIERISSFVDAAWPVVDFLGGPMQAALIGLAAYIFGPMLTAFAVLSGAVIKLGIVILSTPIGWILAGLALLAGGVYLIYSEWDAFVGYWEGVWTRIVGAFDNGWSSIGAALLEFWPGTHVIRAMDYVVEYLTGFSLLDAGSAIFASFGEGLMSSFFAIDSWLAERKAAIIGYFTSIDLSGVGAAVVDSFRSGLQAAWASVVDWFRTAVSSLTDRLPDSLRTRMGLDIEAPRLPAIDPITAGAVPVGPTVPTIGLPQASAPAFSTVGSVPVGPTIGMPQAPQQLAAETVTTNSVDVATFNVPEPILVHQPQAIDASTHVGSIHLHGVQTDNRADIQAAVSGALREQSRRAADAARSDLADQ